MPLAPGAPERLLFLLVVVAQSGGNQLLCLVRSAARLAGLNWTGLINTPVA